MGVVLASPFIMYQVWMFIAPGLYSNEKRLAIPFVLFTTIGFLVGAAFNHYIAFPFMMVFFASFNTPDLAFMPKLDDVFGLYTKMLLGMGIVFQMPTVVFFLAKMKMVTARFLAEELQVRVPDHLRRRGGHHADRRPDDAGDFRRPDGGALHAEHRHRLDRGTEAAAGRQGRDRLSRPGRRPSAPSRLRLVDQAR